MIFGLRSGDRETVGLPRHGTATLSALLGLASALAAITVAGCSGGSSNGGLSNNNNNGGQTQSSTATITGFVVDKENNLAPDQDAVIVFGSSYTVTGSDGSFSLHIPAGTAGTLLAYGKVVRDGNNNVKLMANGLPESDNTYINTGYYPASSSTQVALLSAGIPIAAQAAGSTDGIGSIGLLTINDPPPPPNFQ